MGMDPSVGPHRTEDFKFGAHTALKRHAIHNGPRQKGREDAHAIAFDFGADRTVSV